MRPNIPPEPCPYCGELDHLCVNVFFGEEVCRCCVMAWYDTGAEKVEQLKSASLERRTKMKEESA